MKSSPKILLSLFAAVLLLALLALLSAATGDDFTAAVGKFDPAAPYADRLEAYEAAARLYDELGTEEKAAVADAHATLEAEGRALAGIEAKAKAFLAAVSRILDATTINNKKAAIDAAGADDVWFADESYPGVTAALADYAREKQACDAQIEVCESFLDAIEEAESAEGYVATRAALDKAAKLLHSIDDEYDGILTAKGIFDELSNLYAEGEDASFEFVRLIAGIADATTYAEKKTAYEYAMRVYDMLIEDYPGVAEAKETAEAAELYFEDCMRLANAFIAAVGDMELRGDLYTAAKEALAKREGVDLTVEGVSSANAALQSAIADINETVRAANAVQESLASAAGTMAIGGRR